MKSGFWMGCVIFFMFLVAPVLMVLTVLGPLGAGPATVFLYWLPAVLCAIIVTAVIFSRQGLQKNKA